VFAPLSVLILLSGRAHMSAMTTVPQAIADELSAGTCGTSHFTFPMARVAALRGVCLFDEPDDRNHRQGDCAVVAKRLDGVGTLLKTFSKTNGEFEFPTQQPGRYALVICSNGGSTYRGVVVVDPAAKQSALRLYLKWLLPPPPAKPDPPE
jgi:hypothetical protein